MTTPSRSVGLELTVANKPQFMAEMEEIARQVNGLFTINLPGGSGVPSAPSMPTAPSQQTSPQSYLGTVNPSAPVQPAQSQAQVHQQTVANMPNGVPTTVPQPQRQNAPGNTLGQLGHGYHRFRHVAGTVLPMYSALLGTEAIGLAIKRRRPWRDKQSRFSIQRCNTDSAVYSVFGYRHGTGSTDHGQPST